MTNRPFFSFLLFLASFIICGSLLFGLSGCKSAPPEPKATIENPKKLPVEPSTVPQKNTELPLTFDFKAAPLGDVVPIVTEFTGISFVFIGVESTPITWSVSNLPKQLLFDSFSAALKGSDLNITPLDDRKKSFKISTLDQKPKNKTVLLNFARSSRGLFISHDDKIYTLQKFPYPVMYDNGHFYASVPDLGAK